MKKHFIRLIVVAIAFICSAAANFAQKETLVRPKGIDAQNESANLPVRSSVPEKEFKIDVNLVNITVSVRDQNDKAVLGLAKEMFQVRENKVLQEISFFSDADLPASVLFLFDTSGSMDGAKIIKAKEAVERFIKTSHPEDEYFAMRFRSTATLIAKAGRDPEAILTQLQSVKASGNTALYDALLDGLQRVSSGIHRKKVIILISDGLDNSSRASFSDVREHFKETGVLLYWVGMGGQVAGKFGQVPQANLEELSKQSGGWTSFPQTRIEMDELSEKLALELRHQYSIAYSPKDFVADGKWRSLTISVVPPLGLKRVRVLARRGYFARPVDRSVRLGR